VLARLELFMCDQRPSFSRRIRHRLSGEHEALWLPVAASRVPVRLLKI
jgi:hypothetical protein